MSAQDAPDVPQAPLEWAVKAAEEVRDLLPPRCRTMHKDCRDYDTAQCARIIAQAAPQPVPQDVLRQIREAMELFVSMEGRPGWIPELGKVHNFTMSEAKVEQIRAALSELRRLTEAR